MWRGYPRGFLKPGSSLAVFELEQPCVASICSLLMSHERRNKLCHAEGWRTSQHHHWNHHQQSTLDRGRNHSSLPTSSLPRACGGQQVIVPILCQQMEAFVAMKRLFEVKLNWSRWWICACQRHFWPEKCVRYLLLRQKLDVAPNPWKTANGEPRKLQAL